MKGGIKLASQTLKLTKYQNSQAGILTTIALGTAIATENNEADNKDSMKNRIELLVSSVVEFTIKNLLTNSIKDDKSSEGLKYILFFLWMILKNNDVTDLQHEVVDLGIIEYLKQIRNQYEKTSLPILTLGVAVLRRLITCKTFL